jgi:hypothetical protein
MASRCFPPIPRVRILCAKAALGDALDFQTIPNEFDDDRDGWAELLVHSTGGVSARFTLELHTDLGLVPTKTAFERKLVSPESCVDER